MHEWPCAEHAAQRYAGNVWVAKRVAQGRADNVVGREAHGLEDTGELQAVQAWRMGRGRGTLQWDMWRGAAGRFGPQGARCVGGRVRTWETTGNPTAR